MGLKNSCKAKSSQLKYEFTLSRSGYIRYNLESTSMLR